MSKNFELLQRAEYGRQVAPVVEFDPAARPELGTAVAGSHPNPLNIGRMAKEESLKLVQRLFLAKSTPVIRTVVFAGIDHGNGCSRICADAAATLASNTTGSVCIVDANLRSPTLPEMFGVTNHFGLTDALRQEGPARRFARQLRPDNLWLLSCGSTVVGASAVLDRDRLKLRLAALREEFDYVLIDTPPLNQYDDAVVLGQFADGLVLVLEANATRREPALRVVENLRAAQVQVLGAVLNKRTFPIPEVLYQRI
jgi:capsular exopolysaccharide synthesis family protein